MSKRGRVHFLDNNRGVVSWFWEMAKAIDIIKIASPRRFVKTVSMAALTDLGF